MLQIVTRPDPMTQAVPTPTPFMVELRTSLEAGTVTWALAQADYALKGRPLPEKITDLHHDERRKYEDAALVALLSVNRDAELYAGLQAQIVAWDAFEYFCQDNNLDWTTHPINQDDKVEIAIELIAQKAVTRFRHTLCGVFPGLSQHLARVERLRALDNDPEEAV